MARLPSVGGDVNSWGSVLNTFLQVAHNAAGTLIGSPGVYNVKDDAYGAKGDGTTDDTTAIQAAITACQTAGGGTVWLPQGSFVISAPLAVTANNVTIAGAGRFATTILQKSTFSGAGMITLADGITIGTLRDFAIQGATSTYSGNPACDGINMTGANDIFLQSLYIEYMNGWGVNSKASSANGVRNIMYLNVHVHSSAQGFQILGLNASNNVGLHYLIGCNSSATQNGDAYLIQDIHDIVGINLLGSSASTGSSLHIKGKASAIYISNIDFGPAPGPSGFPIILIESGTNGTPQQIHIQNGIIEGGSVGANITAGTDVRLSNLTIYNNGTDGVDLSGALNGVVVENCHFNQNNTSGSASAYAIQCTANTGSNILIQGNFFNDPQGTTAQHMLACLRDSNSVVTFANNYITGASFTVANYFLNGPANIVKNVYPFAWGTNTAAPSIGASPFTPTAKNQDCAVYVTGGTVSSIAIAGVATGLTSGFFIVPANQTITLTYSVAPTWTWYRLP